MEPGRRSVAEPLTWALLFLGKQRGDVVQRFSGAVRRRSRTRRPAASRPPKSSASPPRRVALPSSPGAARRGAARRDTAPIASCSSAWLFSVNLSPRLNAPIAFRTISCRNDCLPESETSIFSSTERRKRSSGLRSSPVIGSLNGAVVERRLDFVEVLVEQVLRFLLEGDEKRLVDVLLHPLVVEILARDHQEIDPLALLLRVDARVGLDRVLEPEQHVHRGQALSPSSARSRWRAR